MNVDHLQDRLYWGLNRTAAILGRVTDAYRATSTDDPLDRSNRYLQLPAAFSRADGNFGQPLNHGVALWRGHFDASYTRVGDYLVHERDIWFIAAQHCLLPILCVKTNKVISIARQIPPSTVGWNNNADKNSTIDVITRWPASLLGTGTEGTSSSRLPGDTALPAMIALLPATHAMMLQPADLITDEHGTTSTIVAAELSDLGWRLNIRLIST